MKQKKLKTSDIERIRARYDMIIDKYKDSSLEELKTVFNDKSQIKSSTDRQAIVYLTDKLLKINKNINNKDGE